MRLGSVEMCGVDPAIPLRLRSVTVVDGALRLDGILDVNALLPGCRAMALSSARRRPVAAFPLLVVLVATNLVAIRYSNRELPPFWDAGARFALAALIFAVIVARRPPPART